MESRARRVSRLDFKAHEKTNAIRAIVARQILSERRLFAQFHGIRRGTFPLCGRQWPPNRFGRAGSSRREMQIVLTRQKTANQQSNDRPPRNATVIVS
jgi:hypothetical protein